MGNARIFVNELNVVPRLPAVSGFVTPPRFVGTKQVTENRHVNYIGILRIDDNACYGLRILQAHLREGLAAVGRFIDAVTKAGTLAVVGLAGAHPDDFGVRRSNRDISNRSSRISINNRLESCAVIRSFPDSAGSEAHVINISIALDHGDVVDASAHACRSDAAPNKTLQHRTR